MSCATSLPKPLRDLAFAEAIRAGQDSELVTRGAVFEVLEGKGVKILFRASVLRDLNKIRDPAIMTITKAAIEEAQRHVLGECEY